MIPMFTLGASAATQTHTSANTVATQNNQYYYDREQSIWNDTGYRVGGNPITQGNEIAGIPISQKTNDLLMVILMAVLCVVFVALYYKIMHDDSFDNYYGRVILPAFVSIVSLYAGFSAVYSLVRFINLYY